MLVLDLLRRLRAMGDTIRRFARVVEGGRSAPYENGPRKIPNRGEDLCISRCLKPVTISTAAAMCVPAVEISLKHAF